MILKDITSAIESVAPLYYQDDFDNSGLQVGCSPKEIHSVLVCLDITEDVVDEAIERGADMIISHHPLIFKALVSTPYSVARSLSSITCCPLITFIRDSILSTATNRSQFVTGSPLS